MRLLGGILRSRSLFWIQIFGRRKDNATRRHDSSLLLLPSVLRVGTAGCLAGSRYGTLALNEVIDAVTTGVKLLGGLRAAVDVLSHVFYLIL